MNILIKLLPHILTLLLLFLPDIIYKISGKTSVQKILSDLGVVGHSPTLKLENQIKANFDFVAFSSSGISLLFGILYSLKQNQEGIYELTEFAYFFIAVFVVCWFLTLILSVILLNKGKQPGIIQKSLVVVALAFSIYMSIG